MAMAHPSEKKKYYKIFSLLSSLNNASDSDTDEGSGPNPDQYEEEQKKREEKLKIIVNNFEFLQNASNKEVDVKSSSAKAYGKGQRVLQNRLEIRLKMINELKKFKFVILEREIKSKEESGRQQYEIQGEILHDLMKSDLDAQMEKLQTKCKDLDSDAALWLGRSLTRSGRGRDRVRYPHGYIETKNKPVATKRPSIDYMLKEHEILEDCVAIKKSSLKPKKITKQK